MASREELGAGDFLFIALVAGCGSHDHGDFDVAVRMKKRRGLLTEPSQQPAWPSRRQCDPGLRHSLNEENGPVEDSSEAPTERDFNTGVYRLALPVAERQGYLETTR